MWVEEKAISYKMQNILDLCLKGFIKLSETWKLGKNNRMVSPV